MRRSSIIAVLFSAASPLAFGQTDEKTGRASQTVQEVAQINREFNQALGGNDPVALDHIVAEDFVFTNERGIVFGKDANCRFVHNISPTNLEQGNAPPTGKTLHEECPR